MRRLLTAMAAGALVGGALALGSLTAAAADDSYCSQPGCTQAFGETICAGHGSFGAFGQDNNFAGGADGELTGLNNSSLCGNPQGNP
jgi:hypothetical protein